MTPERIIANIENYISLQSTSEQELYSEYLRLAETNYQNIKEISCVKNSMSKHDPLLELVEIVQELKREIKQKMQKDTKGKSFVTRSKKLTKLMAKNQNDVFKKSVIEEEVVQCCILGNGYYGFVLKNHLDVPIFTEDESKNFNNFAFHSGEFSKRYIPSYEDYKTVEFDIVDIKSKLSLHKVKKDKTECKLEIDGTIFNAEYFVNIIEILGENVTMYKHPNKINEIVVFENDNGIGLLAPMRR